MYYHSSNFSSPAMFESFLSGILTILFPSVFMVLIWRFYSFKKEYKRNETELCESPDCLRCNKNTVVTKLAQSTFQQIFSFDKKLERIKTAVLSPSSPSKFVLYIEKLKSHSVWNIKDLPDSYKSDIKKLEESAKFFLQDYYFLEDKLFLEKHETCRWSRLYLFNQGVQNLKVTNVCTKTVSMLKKCNNIIENCLFGYVFFSVVHPNTVIAEHTGPTNIRLRCHIALTVPELGPGDKCELIVAGKKVEWKQGRAVLFDDSLVHSVEYTSNNEQASRIVLLVDFWHPDLRPEEKLCIQKCYS